MKSTGPELDELDRGILAELRKDGKTPATEIAERLGVSDGTISFSINRQASRGFLRVTAIVNPFAFPDTIIAFIGMELEKRTHAATMERIAQLKGVVSVCNVTGKYDLWVEVFLESRQMLRSFLVEGLAEVEGINRTETFLVLDAINKWIELPGAPEG